MFKRLLYFLCLVGVIASCCCSHGSAQVSAKQTEDASKKAQFDEAFRRSVLVHGKQPFHLLLTITPGKNATEEMQGSIELFWLDAAKYKMVVTSPMFTQTKVVIGSKVQETDEGAFLPRWLDAFIQAIFMPIPRLRELEQDPVKFSVGGSFVTPRGSFVMNRCVNIADRPGGITEETSIAGGCLEQSHPWIASGGSFVRGMSFNDFELFGHQQIPRAWSTDIPQNIFVNGRLQVLEKLSKDDAALIRITQPTPSAAQIRTVFISRHDAEALVKEIPAFEWPAENTEALEGYMIVYVRTDREGVVRESYWDSSDNFKLQNAGVELALKTTFKPLVVDGVAVQVEAPLVLHFKTHRDPNAPDPMPPSRAYLP